MIPRRRGPGARMLPGRPTAALCAISLVLATAPSHAANLTRGPYLQQVTDHGGLVIWRTNTAVACTLEARPPSGPSVRVFTGSGTEHVAALGGLQPGTRYDYTIRSGNLLAAGPDYFVRTAPLPGTGATTRLVVWGDCGNATASQMAVANVLNQQNVDLGLVVGDIIYPSGQAAYYDPRFFTPYAPLLRKTPTWAAIGNHDMGTPSAYFAAWYLPTNSMDGSEKFYSFDYGDIHIAALDSNGGFGTTAMNWLAADLAASDRKWKMVFFHHTIYSCGDYHGSSSSNRTRLAPIVEAAGVDLVLYGHDHHYERTWPMRNDDPVGQAMNPNFVNPGAPIYVVSGGGGGSRASSNSCDHTARAISTPSFVRLSITGDLLTLEAIDTNNAIIDRMTLQKTGSGPPPGPVETIQLVQPLGGERFEAGTVLPVRWSASPTITAVRLELSRNGTSGPWETIAASTPNDGEHLWTVTAPASSHCFMRISAANDGHPAVLTATAFGIDLPPDPEIGEEFPDVIGINFQPQSAPVPIGYVFDLGLPFDESEGYGWNATVVVRERGVVPGSPNDTFVDVVNDAPPSVWEIVVPNGMYRATIVCGDVSTTATHRVALEGQIVIRDEPTFAGQFYQLLSMPVLVNDGKLTMTLGGSGDITHTKVNSIVIVAGDPAPHAITGPAAGENFCVGAMVPIRWQGATAGAMVRLDVSRNGAAGPWQTVAMSPDDGEESWFANAPASANCLLRVCDLQGNVLAQSSTPFTVSEAVLQLVRPNGGEVWMVGSTRSFEWTTSCLAGTVRIEVSRQGAGGPWTTLIPSTPNDTFESWLVRPEDTGWTHVRIVALPFEIPSDLNDAPFSVAEAPVEPIRSWRIDFTTPTGALAAGWTADRGLLYDATRKFGWNKSVLTRQRNMLPNDPCDTFVQVQNNSPATWEVELPNGDYRVALMCGDPQTSGTHRVALEGQIVVDNIYAVGGAFVTRTELPVSITDGRLTVTLGGNGQITSTKLCRLEVVSLSALGPRRGGRPRELAASYVDRLDLAEGPVRGRALFAVELSQPGNARLAVHDVRGRLVAMLHDGALAAGRHEFGWQPRDRRGDRLPSGVYFLRIDSPTLHTTRKLIVIR